MSGQTGRKHQEDELQRQLKSSAAILVNTGEWPFVDILCASPQAYAKIKQLLDALGIEMGFEKLPTAEDFAELRVKTVDVSDDGQWHIPRGAFEVTIGGQLVDPDSIAYFDKLCKEGGVTVFSTDYTAAAEEAERNVKIVPVAFCGDEDGNLESEEVFAQYEAWLRSPAGREILPITAKNLAASTAYYQRFLELRQSIARDN